MIRSWFCVVIILLIVGCEGEESNNDASSRVKLPERLEIAFDMEEVTEVKEAKIYTANLLELDPDVVANTILVESLVNEEINAFGFSYQTKGDVQEEYLTVYDGGKTFGVESGMEGGFGYWNHSIDHPVNYQQVAHTSPGPPDQSTQFSLYQQNNNFQTFTDLDFISYSEAEQEIIDQLSSLGIDGVETEIVYGLDYETITTHYEHYLNLMAGSGEDAVQWTDDDEAYLFQFRQVVDGIPLMNDIWQTRILESDEITYTRLTAIYKESGIHTLEVVGFYETTDASESQTLIDQEEALEKLIDYYNTVLLKSATRIENMELTYISFLEDGNYRLVPSWVFLISREEQTEPTEIDPALEYVDYQYHIINAVTGERIINVSGDSN